MTDGINNIINITFILFKNRLEIFIIYIDAGNFLLFIELNSLL